MVGVNAGGRLGGAKRQQRNNFGPPWNKYRGELRVGGNSERASHSRIHRGVVCQDGKPEFWYGEGRRLGGRMTSCGRRRCWDGYKVRIVGQMNSFGSYGGYYSSRGGMVELHNNKCQSLIL